MKRKQKAWFFRPPKPPKPKVPENIKTEVETKARELVKSFLKPNYIKPPPENKNFSYITDKVHLLYLELLPCLDT